MTNKERFDKVNYLKNIQHYSDAFYKKMTSNQLLAMYYKTLTKISNREGIT